ncbi:MAG: hypothetical protein R3Y47_09655 [Lachnospiraceae bacterium]
MKKMFNNVKTVAANKVGNMMRNTHQGIDGILVTVGLCIVALVVCVVFKTEMSTFVEGMMGEMTSKASSILSGTA